MTFDELYKKVINASKAFEERQVPIRLDFKIEDLRDALVESNDTIEKLKKKLEDAKATAYAESVDAGMENRRLKRALWLARAERANEIHYMWCQFIYDRKYCIVKFNVKKEWGRNIKQGQTLHTPQGWADVWEEVQHLCMTKAKEYK